MEILRHWAPVTPEAMVRRMSERSGIKVEQSDVEELAKFLSDNELVVTEVDGHRTFVAKRAAQDANWTYKYISKYFFIRIPLVNPQDFLDATYPLVRFVYSRTFLIFTLALTFIGFFLVFRQLDTFLTSASDLISLDHIGWFAAALILSKICHELGHGYTAIRYGCRVPSMGVAFMVLWPVLYTETSSAWKLSDTAKRQFINSAGVLTELLIASYATLLWSFLPDGAARDAVFYLAVVGWTLSLAVNLNPFMRFDGYYILSDLVSIPNLHHRSSRTRPMVPAPVSAWPARPASRTLAGPQAELCCPVRFPALDLSPGPVPRDCLARLSFLHKNRRHIAVRRRDRLPDCKADL